MQVARQILTSAMVLAVLTATSAADVIQWAPDLQTARRQAVEQNKPLLIHFWTPDCAPCKIVERNVFPRPDVAQAINANYVPLKVNAYENAELRNHFKVKQWPTDVVATVDGRSLFSMVTPQAPGRYVNSLMSVVAAVKKSPATNAQFASQGSDASRASNQPAVQQTPAQPSAQQQLPPASRWAGNVAAPHVAPSTAVARAPGIPPHMQPGANRNFTSQAADLSDPNRYSAPQQGSSLPPRIAHGQSGYSSYPAHLPAPPSQAGTVNNHLVQQPNQVSNHQAAQPQQVTPSRPAEIANPYVQQGHLAASPTNPAQANGLQNAGNQAGYAAQQMATTSNQPAANYADNRAAQQGANVHQGQVTPAQQNNVAQQNNAAQQIAGGPMSNPQAVQQAQGHVQDAMSAAPAQNPPIGLDGRCPVTLITQGKWKKGDVRFGAIHRGFTYLFADQESQQLFLGDPDKFSPVLAGMDIVQLADGGQIVQGSRRFGVLFDDDGVEGQRDARIYLFGSMNSRDRFEANPDKFLQPVQQARQSGSLDSLLR